MAQSNFLRLFAIFSLAILNISFDALPVNALAVERGHVARGVNHAHAGVAKKRGDSKQCKPRPVTSTLTYTSSTSSHHSSANAHLATPASEPQSSTHQTTTTSSSPTPSVAPPSSGSNSGSKVGLAWSNNEEGSIGNFITSNTKYVYNWQMAKYSSSIIAPSKWAALEFVPTIHGRSEISQINLLTAGYAKKVKTFNEPEQPSQAAMSPDEAYGLWTAHIEPLTKLGYEIIGPSVTTGSDGFNWLSKFMGLCKTCSISITDVHFYGLNAQDLIDDVNKFHTSFGKPIWLSEYACVDYSGSNKPCTQSNFNSFFQTAQSFLEGASFVEMYAMFGMFRADELPNNVDTVNSLMTCPSGTSSCKPNSFGERYLNP